MTDKEREFPWSDCKVAYSVEEDAALWEWNDQHNYAPPLPHGWSLCETDGSGARMVAVFRIEGELRREDGERVATILRDLGIASPASGADA